MITFTLAVFFLMITPGPGVMSTAGVGSAFGFRAGLKYVLGLFIGTNIVALCVITGLAAILFSVPWVRWMAMGLSILYLLYLAARIALAGSKIAFIKATIAPGIGAGILLQAINPKAYVVNATLFTGFPFAPESLALETMLKLLIANAIWIPIHFGWLWAGASLHRLNLSDRAQRRINYAMAGAMLAVVALALLAGARQA
ncbi:MAG: threonine/homoserine/homoserine lactone efflux protein [Pseudorhodobacter sp.]|jgi:threonine/homoserine/homoserine lactone efflux protein